MKTMKQNFILIATLALIQVIGSCSLSGQTAKVDEGSSYSGIKIGSNIWTDKNLDVSAFRNGDPIPEARTAAEWEKAAKDGKPAWCYYENDTVNGKKFGKLYNWFALTDPRGLAPAGWRVPSNEDWRTVTGTLGGVDMTGMKLKSTNGWQKREYANNKSGFSALPGGIRDVKGKFSDLNYRGQWWSTSPVMGGGPEVFSFMVKDPSIEAFYLKLDKGTGLSVRLVKE
jgi:uncharacterized protein (TIGR02145 family)